MVKRVYPVCDNRMWSESGANDVWKCTRCGAEVGPELNVEVGVSVEKPSFPMVGQVTKSNHSILAVYKNEYVLARSNNPNDPQPFAVWSLNEDGDAWGGSYYKDEICAERCFVEWCFKWFKRSGHGVIAPVVSPEASASGVMIDIGRMSKNAAEKPSAAYKELNIGMDQITAISQAVKESGVPTKVYLDNPCKQNGQ